MPKIMLMNFDKAVKHNNLTDEKSSEFKFDINRIDKYNLKNQDKA